MRHNRRHHRSDRRESRAPSWNASYRGGSSKEERGEKVREATRWNSTSPAGSATSRRARRNGQSSISPRCALAWNSRVVVVDDAEHGRRRHHRIYRRDSPARTARCSCWPRRSRIRWNSNLLLGRASVVSFATTARTTRIRLGDLSEEALVDLVRFRAPNTTFEIADVIASHAAGNPLVLGGLLDSLPIRRTLSNGSYQIDDPEEVVAGLFSDSYEGTLTAYWNQLPDEIRQLLAIASSRPARRGQLRPQRVPGRLRRQRAGGRALPRPARTPHSWLADVDDFLDRFTDGALLGIASMNQERVGRSVVPRARRAMIDDLRARRADTPAWTALTRTPAFFLKFYFSVVKEGIEGEGTPIAPENRGGCGCRGRAGGAD